jgi:nanoRNase/pAp phosphatase (c-di-AMP/oligoRNAs hydrolase)
MEEDAGAAQRPLLVMISESAELTARVRSRERTVCRWEPDAPAGRAGSFGGDPTDPASYEWTRGAPGVIAVIDVAPADRARAVLAALRAVRPDAAVLLLTAEAADLDGPADGTLVRGGELRNVLRVDLDDELHRLEAERRVYCLREFVRASEVVPILIHEDPDPDAVSSAFALAALVGGSAERTPIVTLNPMTRPENRRMAELLHITVTKVTLAELQRFERVITVDTQPRSLQRDGRPRVAVIDHHPVEDGYDADFADIRPSYGATATMVTEYLRATDEQRVSRPLATALLFGIKTDTSSLSRGVSAADVEAYAFLQERADAQLVRRFERPIYTIPTAQRFGHALAHAAWGDGVCVAWVGDIDEDAAHLLADVADFCQSIENVTWSAAAALVGGELVLTLRHAGGGAGADRAGGVGAGAGALARLIAARHSGAEGGGHRAMARVTIPDRHAVGAVGAVGADAAEAVAEEIREMLAEAIRELEASSNRPDSRRARPASDPAGSSR